MKGFCFRVSVRLWFAHVTPVTPVIFFHRSSIFQVVRQRAGLLLKTNLGRVQPGTSAPLNAQSLCSRFKGCCTGCTVPFMAGWLGLGPVPVCSLPLITLPCSHDLTHQSTQAAASRRGVYAGSAARHLPVELWLKSATRDRSDDAKICHKCKVPSFTHWPHKPFAGSCPVCCERQQQGSRNWVHANLNNFEHYPARKKVVACSLAGYQTYGRHCVRLGGSARACMA